MKTPALLALVAAAAFFPSPTLRAEEAPTHWYCFRVNVTGSTSVFYGASPLDETSLMKRLEGPGFITLSNLVYLDDKEQPKDWTECSRYEAPRVLVNPKDVVYVIPLLDDPRKIAALPAK